MIDLRDLTLSELREYMVSIGEKAFRGDQIFEFIYKGATTIDDVKNISSSTKEKILQTAYISSIKIYKKLESKIDSTVKYLIELEDGNIVESVLMEYKHGYSVCISSQVGCRMGCSFCASTIDGLARNLTPGEIIGQLLVIQKDMNIKISNIVMMGSGEPLDNFENVKKFFELVHEEKGLNIGYRHITLSTCGIVPKMIELAKLDLPINLAISLHQWNQEKRAEIMPIGKAYSVDEVIDAAYKYYKMTKRRITYEYALIKDVNDTKEDAYNLAKLINKMDCHVNLIPVNEVKENEYIRPDKKRIQTFSKILEENHVKVTVRRELGKDINGACGQLRRSVIKEM